MASNQTAVVPAPTSYRRANVYGRIYTLSALDRNPEAEDNGQIIINFPAMPDSLPLNRVANYVNSARTPVTPDGFHYYEGTDPLEIPIKFSIHAFDREYCGKDGPVAMLNTAARLHAMAMPIVNAPSGIGTGTMSDQLAATPIASGTDASLSQTNVSVGTAQFSSDISYFFPPACRLEIMFAHYGGRDIGVKCDGFITRVGVVLKGPWLQGSDQKQFYNLPTSAEYEFTFVQQPGYTNSVKAGQLNNIIGTSARQIFDRLYNTANIASPGGYVNIDGSSSTGLPGTV